MTQVTIYASREQRKDQCYNPDIGMVTFLSDELIKEIWNGDTWIRFRR